MIKMKRIYTLITALVLGSGVAIANPGDTTWVQANQVNLDYYNNFDTAVSFPDGSVTYRKILMYFELGQYDCPAGTQYCHQWDYTVTNYVMTPTGDTLEIARFITPFATSGWSRFGATWKQPYVFDVTDYANYLKNNASIRIFYSGYSGGFTADVKFAFIEGVPDRNVTGIDKIYKGYYAYGDTANPINNNLPIFNSTAPAGTSATFLKTLISGHGSDDNQCCEFASHSFDLLLNNNVIKTTEVWRDDCGVNHMYPQGGTWVFDRANWCPGDIVYPYKDALPNIVAGSAVSTQIQFEDYTVASATGGYSLESQVVYYGDYNKAVDASIDEIISPNNFAPYFRENPASNLPIIKLHNSGSAPLTSVAIEYGMKDSAKQQYTWTGTLAPSADIEIELPALTSMANLAASSASGTFVFEANVLQTNGQADEDATNDTLRSSFVSAPVWPSDLVVKFHTGNIGRNGNLNANPVQGTWSIFDADGNVVASQTNAASNMDYLDTVHFLAPGFYTIKITSEVKDAIGFCLGLHWWALEQSGVKSGALWVQKLDGTNLPMKGYKYLVGTNYENGGEHDDFGCEYTQTFYVSEASTGIEAVDFKGQFKIYPIPADNNLLISYSEKLTEAMNISLVNVIGQTVFSTTTKSNHFEINTSTLPAGTYSIICTSGNSKKVQKVTIAH